MPEEKEDAGYMTVGELKKLIVSLADDMPVVLEVVKGGEDDGDSLFADSAEVEEQEDGTNCLFITGYAE